MATVEKWHLKCVSYTILDHTQQNYLKCAEAVLTWNEVGMEKTNIGANFALHSKTPHVVTVLWLDSDYVVTILSPTRNLVDGFKTVYLCHLDSHTVTVCNRYLVPSNLVTVQLPTRCQVNRFLHRPHGSGYLITCVFDVVTVQLSQCRELENPDYIVTVVVTVPSRWLME